MARGWRASAIRIILLPGRALRHRRDWRHPEDQTCIRIILLPGRALRRSSPLAGRRQSAPRSESSSCPEGHYDSSMPNRASAAHSVSESSSCPEGHYDKLDVALSLQDRSFIRIILLPGRALRPGGSSGFSPRLPVRSESSSCPEGHYDRLERAAHGEEDILHPNHPPARKGITTTTLRTSGREINPNHPPARKGIETEAKRGSRWCSTCHPNHPPARKGITMALRAQIESKPEVISESPSCPEGHYDLHIGLTWCTVPHVSESPSCLEGHYDPNGPKSSVS